MVDLLQRKKGLFVVIDGVDGTGKTTLIEIMARDYRERGIPVTVLRDPGSSVPAERLRSLLKDPDVELCQEQRLMLHHCARLSLIREQILPAYHEGHLVLCDRFISSTYAMQFFTEGCSEKLFRLLQQQVDGLIEPDRLFVLDADRSQILERLENRTGVKQDHYDQQGEDYHESVREGYLQYLTERPGYVIDQTEAKDYYAIPENVARYVMDVMEPLINATFPPPTKTEVIKERFANFLNRFKFPF